MAIFDLDRCYIETTDEINWTQAEYNLQTMIYEFERSIIKSYRKDCPHLFLENELFALLRQYGINPFESVTNIYYGQGSDLIMNFNGVNADMVIPAIAVPDMMRNYINLSTMPLTPEQRYAFSDYEELEYFYRLFLRYTKESVLLLPYLEDWEITRYGLPVVNNLEYVRDMQSFYYPEVSVHQLFDHTEFDFRFWGIFHNHPAVKGNKELTKALETAATIMEKGLGMFFHDFFSYLYKEHSEYLIHKKQTAIEASFQKWAEKTCSRINLSAPAHPTSLTDSKNS